MSLWDNHYEVYPTIQLGSLQFVEEPSLSTQAIMVETMFWQRDSGYGVSLHMLK